MTGPTGPAHRRLGDGPQPPSPGVRVVLDARPLQAPERAPLAAAYLDGLLGAFDADPLNGESFAFLIGSDADDPTVGGYVVTGHDITDQQLADLRLLKYCQDAIDRRHG